MRKWNKKNKKQIHNYTHEIYVENTCTSCKMRSPMSQTLRSAYYYSPVIIILFPDKKTIILSGVYCISIALSFDMIRKLTFKEECIYKCT